MLILIKEHLWLFMLYLFFCFIALCFLCSSRFISNWITVYFCVWCLMFFMFSTRRKIKTTNWINANVCGFMFVFLCLRISWFKDEYLISLIYLTMFFYSLIYQFTGHGGVNQLGGVFVNGNYCSICFRDFIKIFFLRIFL